MPIIHDTIESTYKAMREKLLDIVPDIELGYKAELVYDINRLKKQRNALILGHNYMEPALYHCVPDFVGDSLELCRLAQDADQPTIVFCGVRFMAETAKILNPDKTVLIPSVKAGCSLAESITAADVRRLKTRFAGVPVVSYINTSAEVKAESDACCTSSNAAAVIESFSAPTVVFLPDEYLARNVARETGKHVIVPMRSPDGAALYADEIEYAIVGWDGRCEVHEKFAVDDIRRIRQQFPGVAVLAHPECSPTVTAASDFSGSTSAMIRFVRDSDAPRYLLLTECCMGDNIAAENPHKEMLRLCSVRCPHMNEISLEQTRASLLECRYEVDVPPHIRVRARRALDRMLDVSPVP